MILVFIGDKVSHKRMPNEATPSLGKQLSVVVVLVVFAFAVFCYCNMTGENVAPINYVELQGKPTCKPPGGTCRPSRAATSTQARFRAMLACKIGTLTLILSSSP